MNIKKIVFISGRYCEEEGKFIEGLRKTGLQVALFTELDEALDDWFLLTSCDLIILDPSGQPSYNAIRRHVDILFREAENAQALFLMSDRHNIGRMQALLKINNKVRAVLHHQGIVEEIKKLQKKIAKTLAIILPGVQL